jgi:peroxiredoxin
MRKQLFSIGIFALALMFLASCSNQKKNANGYSVAININGLTPETNVVLQKRVNGEWVKLDSVTLKDGKGTITGEVKAPELLYLAIPKFNVYVPMWLENSDITVTAGMNSLRTPVIKGSKTEDAYKAYTDSIKRFRESEMKLEQDYTRARMAKQEEKMKVAEQEYDQIENQRIGYMISYVMRHNKSVISPYLIMRNSFALTLGQLDSVTNNFDSTLAQDEYVKMLKDRVAVLKRVAPGQHFTDFTLDSPEGKPISLASVVKDHKYTLVDFWASWCGPCRAENPNVVAAFKKFHKKGFTVFGVSFDRDHDSWVKAIKKDGLDWTQVSDLKFWQSAAGKLYGVQSIPHNVLINEKGIIIAQDLRGQALQDKLKTLMK